MCKINKKLIKLLYIVFSLFNSRASQIKMFKFCVFLFTVFVFAVVYGMPCGNRSYTNPSPDYYVTNYEKYLKNPTEYIQFKNFSKFINVSDPVDTKTFEPFDDCNPYYSPSQPFPLQCGICDKCITECQDAGYGYACCYWSNQGDQHRACCCYKQPSYCDVNPRCAITVCNPCF